MITNFYGRKPVASRGDLAVFEIEDRYYAVECGDYQVRSIGSDNPRSGGRWFANGASDEAIKYVARGRTRRAAVALMQREADCAMADVEN